MLHHTVKHIPNKNTFKMERLARPTTNITGFRKNQYYKFSQGDITVDGSCPSDKSIIKILSAKGNIVRYETLSGNAPKRSSERFWKDSEMTKNLTIVTHQWI